jgi:hypothetical protein
MKTTTLKTGKGKSPGHLTSETAKFLQVSLKNKGYDVLFDHGDPSDKNVGNIVSWYGDGKKPERETELSQIDMAVIEHGSDRAIALIEVEETNDKPKTFLGDVFSILLGDHINFRETPLSVGLWTTLIVVGLSKESQLKRNQHILARVERVKSTLSSKNSSIGKVVIKIFSDEAKLPALLLYELDKVFKGEL